MHLLPAMTGKCRKVSVARAYSVAVFEHNCASVAPMKSGSRPLHPWRDYRLTHISGNIHAHMERAFPVNGSMRSPKRACYLAFDRPKIGHRRGAHPIRRRRLRWIPSVLMPTELHHSTRVRNAYADP